MIPASELRPALMPIPPGGFVQGEGAEPAELLAEPPHPVCITHGFLMMETEVTLGHFFKVVKGFEGDAADMLKGEERCIGHVLPCVRVPRTPDSPMAEVGFHGLLRYANELSWAEGLSPCYRGDAQHLRWEGGLACTGYRLPTEAEWEYSARAGQSTRYAGSNNADEVSWHAENSARRSHPVKSAPLRPNRWGLFDMSGNVLEWVWDFYAPYQASTTPLIDPLGPEHGLDRVIRGGSYMNPRQYHLVSSRTMHERPLVDAPYIGFRLVRSYR